MNLSVHLKWDIRIAEAVTEIEKRSATADGANKVFTMVFGWIPAGIYVWFWHSIWRLYYWFTGKIK